MEGFILLLAGVSLVSCGVTCYLDPKIHRAVGITVWLIGALSLLGWAAINA